MDTRVESVQAPQGATATRSHNDAAFVIEDDIPPIPEIELAMPAAAHTSTFVEPAVVRPPATSTPRAPRDEQARSRDTGAGVGVVPSTGAWPPNHLLPRPDSIIGRGSHEELTGEPLALTFSWSSEAAAYAATGPCGGVPVESTIGKPYEHKHALEKNTGLNVGIVNTVAGGICALKYLDQIVAKHSSYRHEGTQSMHMAMERDFRENLAPGPRAVMAPLIEHLPWPELIPHFLHTCGPGDIKKGVQSMLNGVKTTQHTSTRRHNTPARPWQSSLPGDRLSLRTTALSVEWMAEGFLHFRSIALHSSLRTSSSPF